MQKIDNFSSWNQKGYEEINEFFGLGKLLKSFFRSLSEPVKKRIDLITKNIDSKTGAVKNSTELSNELYNSFKSISDDKQADLKNVDNLDDIKKILKEFITEVKAVFVASRVPFTAMVENNQTDFYESLNEDLKQDFSMIMKDTTEKEFDEYLDIFLTDWLEKNNGNVKQVSSKASKFIETMMETFKKKIKFFGPDRLEKLILLSNNKDIKPQDVQKILNDESSSESEVETSEGKKQFLDAISSNLTKGKISVFKLKNEDGSFNITFKNVEL